MLRFLTTLLAALLLGIQPAAPATAASLDYLGQYDPGTPGLNASVAGLDGFAYLGSWGNALGCPGLGVRIVDVRDPSTPSYVSTAGAYPRTTAEHMAVYKQDGRTVLAVGIQRCAAVGDPGGLALWDVTDPAAPYELGFHPTGRASRGVHEFTVGQTNGRTYAYLAVANSEANGGLGDFRVVDISDPGNPVEVADWAARRDARLPVGSGGQCAPVCRGAFAQSFLHSVALSPDNSRAYLSFWDLGMLILDVSNPAEPLYLGRFEAARVEEGNLHSVSIAHDGKLALLADETFAPPWGRLRLVDVQDPSNPVQVATFDTPNSAIGRPSEGGESWYGIHNAQADPTNPNLAYLAWYADGVRLVDVSDAANPYELASWVPPYAPMVWNVAFMDNLVLVSDVNGGLYVLSK